MRRVTATLVNLALVLTISGFTSSAIGEPAGMSTKTVEKDGKTVKETTISSLGACVDQWSVSDSGTSNSGERFIVSVSSSTTSIAELSSAYSGTSGCDNKTSHIEMQQYHFVAVVRENLAKDIARGSGEYVTTMANLEGCPSEAHDNFAQVAKRNYNRIFTQPEFNPEVILLNLENQIAADPLLASQCSEIS